MKSFRKIVFSIVLVTVGFASAETYAEGVRARTGIYIGIPTFSLILGLITMAALSEDKRKSELSPTTQTQLLFDGMDLKLQVPPGISPHQSLHDNRHLQR